MVKVDLHIHSLASDGEHTPQELVQMAKNAGLSVMAITDHDTVSALAEGEQAAKKAGIAFVPGIEFSIDGWDEMHLLGYGIDYRNQELCNYLELLHNERQNRAKRILAYLESKHIVLAYEDVLEKSQGLITRPHIAQVMVEQGYVKDMKEAFTKYLATEEFFRMDKRKRPTLEEAIELVHKAQGIAVLAHAFSLKLTTAQLDSILKSAKNNGLQGLECHYARYNSAQRECLLHLAKKYDFIITTGSDYHGKKTRPEVEVGAI